MLYHCLRVVTVSLLFLVSGALIAQESDFAWGTVDEATDLAGLDQSISGVVCTALSDKKLQEVLEIKRLRGLDVDPECEVGVNFYSGLSDLKQLEDLKLTGRTWSGGDPMRCD